MLALLLAACAATPRTPAASRVEVDAMLSRIHAAAASDQSAITVTPLHAPGVQVLQQQARSAVIKGDLAAAADTLAQALKLEPNSPPLLQAQAELALRRHAWQEAEQKAIDAWKHGPRTGPGCASNWQTVIEVRTLENDPAAADTARKWLKTCHAEAVHRY